MKFGGFSHSAVLLFKRGRSKFEKLIDGDKDGYDMEIHERIIVNGKIRKLNNAVIHKDFKNLEAYIARHNKYSTWGANLRYKYQCTNSYGENTIRPSLFGNSQEKRRLLKIIIIRLPFESFLCFPIITFLD